MVPCASIRRCSLALSALTALCVATWLACPGAANARPGTSQSPVSYDIDDRMDVNNLDMVLTNVGGFAYDRTLNGPGLTYPKGSGNAVVFAAGLWLGAKVNGATRVAVSEYEHEYVPGPMAGGTFQVDQPSFRNYRIDRSGTGFDEYLQDAVPQGAPLDADGDPLVLGDALIWSVYNDADPTSHAAAAGGTAPLGVEVQQSTFAFNRVGPLGNVILVKWRLANKGGNPIEDAYVSVWADPDVGAFTDDLVGCDTTRSLGYAYNATNQDGVYGSTPPAVGFHLLQGPVVGSDTLGMTSFVRYVNGTDPMDADETYHFMTGRRADGSPIHVCDDPLQPVTTFEVSGLDPGTLSSCSNWLDSNPGDRRFLLSSGPFTMDPGDTQVVILAVEVGRSTDRLASIADLRAIADVVGSVYRVILDPTTAVAAFLVDSHADGDAVRLAWRVSESPGTSVTVERRTEVTAWRAIAETALPSDRMLRFEDRDIVAGERYGYRLAIGTLGTRDYSAESWIDVPVAPGTPTHIRLLPGRPNPSSGAFRIGHYVPRRGVFRLSVLDVHGRVIRVLEDRPLPPGWHDSVWDGRDGAGIDVASGVYVLRMEGEGEAAVRKLVLMR